MKKIQVLDCTLRDGGYCNNWRFGKDNIVKIIDKLCDAGIDIVECGFLTNKDCGNPDVSRFESIEAVSGYIKDKKNSKIVLMANYGEFDFDKLPENDGTLYGIRLAFHKDDLDASLEVSKKIIDKGYKVFVQPMVSLRYTDEEFLNLIEKVNEINPYAFYIVDSFGSMKIEELKKLYSMTASNLNDSISIGFHAHNNMQLARANAEWLINNAGDLRNIIIDSSVYGMGRGAGNLNTELMAEYINNVSENKYCVKDLLEIIDEVILDLYEKKGWGYSLPNFLSAKYNVHPYYSVYLENKKTLTLKEMCDIFEKIPADKRYEFDEGCISDIYISYLDNRDAEADGVEILKEALKGKEVLLIAPGKSAEKEKEKIIDFAENNNVTVISVNFVYKNVNPDYIFISNIRRFRQADLSDRNVIATANIKDSVKYKIPYMEYLNNEKGVEDNAVLMLIKFLTDCRVNKIYIAGLDGYSYNMSDNYIDDRMTINMDSGWVEEKNHGIEKMINYFKKVCFIEFVTSFKNIRLEEN